MGMAYPAATADLNGDGIFDLVGFSASPSNATNTLAVAFGHADGSFSAPVMYPLPAGAAGAFSVTIADWNADGHLDVAVNGVEYFYMFLGDGTGHFVPENSGLVFVLTRFSTR